MGSWTKKNLSRAYLLNSDSNLSNLAGNYDYCRHVKDFLFQQFQRCGKDEKELAKAVEYTNANKFQNHRQQWHELSRPIPRKYLEAINVDNGYLVGQT